MNNDRIVRLVVGGVLAVLTALAIAWFLRNFELATEQERTPWSDEARRNPLLAAERLLKRLGVDAADVAYDDLGHRNPGPHDTLIIYPFQPQAGAERRRQLRAWVESGGHLIVAADGGLEGKRRPGLLTDLGVRRIKNPSDEEGYAKLVLKPPGAEKPIAVEFSDRYYLLDEEDEATFRVPIGEEGYGLLQYQVGRGLVTVVSDIGFVHNGVLDQGDNALLLVYLVGMPNAGKVWLIHDVELPSLLALAWEHLPEAIVAASIALVLWLWHLGARLGPFLPPAKPPRRDIGEHLAATAGFYWRNDRAQRLYAHNRDRVLQAWLDKHYVLRGLDPEARDAWMAERAGLPERAVSRALAGTFGSEADFVEMSHCLQRLHGRL